MLFIGRTISSIGSDLLPRQAANKKGIAQSEIPAQNPANSYLVDVYAGTARDGLGKLRSRFGSRLSPGRKAAARSRTIEVGL